MRNLKRVLSLGLASVMLMGMMVVGAGAASKDFTDASEIKNVEAVDVMVALGVLEGGDKGDFQPNSILTREQAAKIICYMLLGTENAEKLATSGAVFSDVAADRWSAPYIGYCVNLGILAGDGQGHFFPEGKLTGAAFAKMLLVALGYDPAIEKYTGNEWTINVAGDAIEAGIAPKGLVLTDDLSRQDAAQMAFQTLSANMVKYANKGTEITNADGSKIVIGATPAEAVQVAGETLSNNYDRRATDAAGLGYQQFCEKYFSDLTKQGGTPDDFGRAADYAWKLNNDDVYTAAQEASVVFTAATSEDDVLKAIKGYSFKNSDNTYTKVIDKATPVTGDPAAVGDLDLGNNAAIVPAVKALTDNGKVVEIFADSDKKVTDVIVITYTVGEVTKVSTNKDGDVTYTISNGAGAKVNYADPDKTDTIVLNGEVAVDDVVTFTLQNNKLYVYTTTSFNGAQSAYNTSKNTITVEGETYTVATGVKKNASSYLSISDFGNSNKADNTYYVDQYGYVVKSTARAASTDYAYIVSAYGSLDSSIDGKTPYVEVRAVLADGTVSVYQVATEKKSGNWYLKGTNTQIDVTSSSTVQGFANGLVTTGVYGYTLDGNVMTLETLGTTLADGSTTLVNYKASDSILKNETSVGSDKGTVLLNKDVTIVIYDDDAKTAKVVTGTSNLGSTALDSYKAVVSGSSNTVGTASIVFDTVTNGVVAESSDYAFIDASKYSTILDGNTEKYVYTGYLADGSTIDLTATSKLTPATSGSSTVGLYKYTSENTVANNDLLRQQDNNDTLQNTKYGYGRLTATGDMLTMGSTGHYYDVSNAAVVYIDGDLSEINDNVGFFVLKTDNGTLTNDVETVFIFRD
ncbi:S-layer homology domain-containing protein [Flavonifractor sp. An91]|uniref:S-layer homology domain-containing protein n=1 Tax=Flavonifractor sp. An91 TaxID=1965665 RepID=UPI0013A65E31|nr:S-layer homology domain-containing protein [Flavonifractor sp. An91]